MSSIGQDLRSEWNRIADAYQRTVSIRVNDVHYAPCSAGELRLGLLGDVRNRRVLELGCGGGQNVVALAMRGAMVTGVDFSDVQIRHARQLAAKHRVSVQYELRDLSTTQPLPTGEWDIILTSFVLEYVDDLDHLLGASYRALSSNGRLVWCDLHPFVSSANLTSATLPAVIESIDYFNRSRVPFDWPLSGAVRGSLYRHHRTLGDQVRAVTRAGFTLRDVIEPELMDNRSGEVRFKSAYWDESIDEQRDLWTKLPYTLIIVADRCADGGEGK